MFNIFYLLTDKTNLVYALGKKINNNNTKQDISRNKCI